MTSFNHSRAARLCSAHPRATVADEVPQDFTPVRDVTCLHKKQSLELFVPLTLHNEGRRLKPTPRGQVVQDCNES
jgi:hypothetical protein